MIEIMDTTLRDGEQTSGVSFAAHEKLSIAQVLLNDLGVNRVEIASARVSDGEFEAVKRVAAWAARSGNLDKLEVLGFVDGTVSLDWIESAGCRGNRCVERTSDLPFHAPGYLGSLESRKYLRVLQDDGGPLP